MIAWDSGEDMQRDKQRRGNHVFSWDSAASEHAWGEMTGVLRSSSEGFFGLNWVFLGSPENPAIFEKGMCLYGKF